MALEIRNLDDLIVRHVHRDFTTLHVDQTVGEALASIRSSNLAQKIVYFYVTDGQDHLVGVVPTRRL